MNISCHSICDPKRYCEIGVSDNEKLLLLNEKWVPPPGFRYPCSNGRKYNVLWEQEYSWLRYSVSCDAAYCCYCLLFGNKVCGKGVNSSVTFQITGYHDWKNAKVASRSFQAHDISEAHKNAATKALSFKEVASGRSKSIHSCLSSVYEGHVERNRAIMLSVSDVVLILGQRNVAFRGHN